MLVQLRILWQLRLQTATVDSKNIKQRHRKIIVCLVLRLLIFSGSFRLFFLLTLLAVIVGNFLLNLDLLLGFRICHLLGWRWTLVIEFNFLASAMEFNHLLYHAAKASACQHRLFDPDFRLARVAESQLNR